MAAKKPKSPLRPADHPLLNDKVGAAALKARVEAKRARRKKPADARGNGAVHAALMPAKSVQG